MRILLDHDRCTLFHGDSARLGEVLAPNTVDAIVCDPPSGISFMGAEWDRDKGGRDAWIRWLADLLAPSFRALKPGGHALFWALPRTSHWTAMAVEEAGFEIRDRVSHLFGTGFPKSLTSNSAEIPLECGTALKPAVEDWWLVRKPLGGLSIAECFARHHTGVIWIDYCRIGTEDTRGSTGNRPENGWGMAQGIVAGSACGRWPAHLTLDEDAAALLDEQSGIVGCGNATDPPERTRETATKAFAMAPGIRRAGKGAGASRFFYVAKPSRSEKDCGLVHLPVSTGGEATGREDGSAGLTNPRAGAGRTGGARNTHPTVKSIALMRWLTRLITRPGGVILDPFAGSGTTGVAALAEGFCFVGVELTDDYLPILYGRIRHALGIPVPGAA